MNKNCDIAHHIGMLDNDHPLIEIFNKYDNNNILFTKWIKLYFNLLFKCKIKVGSDVKEKVKDMCCQNHKYSEIRQHYQTIKENFEKMNES